MVHYHLSLPPVQLDSPEAKKPIFPITLKISAHWSLMGVLVGVYAKTIKLPTPLMDFRNLNFYKYPMELIDEQFDEFSGGVGMIDLRTSASSAAALSFSFF